MATGYLYIGYNGEWTSPTSRYVGRNGVWELRQQSFVGVDNDWIEIDPTGAGISAIRPPYNLQASYSSGSGTMFLIWNTRGITPEGYRVYKSYSPVVGGDYGMLVATLDDNTRWYEDEDVVEGEAYYYTVSSFGEEGGSSVEKFSSEIRAKTRLLAPGNVDTSAREVWDSTYLVATVTGPIHIEAPNGTQWSLDGSTWYSAYGSSVSVGPTSTVPETKLFIRPSTDTSPNLVFTFRTTPDSINNFKGVDQWWDSEKTIRVNVGSTAFYVPDTAPINVIDMSNMFQSANMFDQDISNWDMSNVVNVERMFRGANLFNQDLSNWNMSNVTNMERMFQNARSFNQDLSMWDVSNVTNMADMFYDATAFNGNISNWDTSSVTDMGRMFAFYSSFNQDISGWDVSNVTNMFEMFNLAWVFNQDLSGWCVSGIPTKPAGFDEGAYDWTLPKPIWGTCPSGDN